MYVINKIIVQPGGNYCGNVETLNQHFSSDNSSHPTQVNIKTADAVGEESNNCLALPLPKELNTPEALRLLNLAKEQGWLDDNFQPTLKTKEQVALVASRISKILFGYNKWSIFESYWGQKNMAQYFQNGLNFSSHQDFNSLIIDTIK